MWALMDSDGDDGGGGAAAADPELAYFREIGFFAEQNWAHGQLGRKWNGGEESWGDGGFEQRTHTELPGYAQDIQTLTDTVFRTSFQSNGVAMDYGIPRAYAIVAVRHNPGHENAERLQAAHAGVRIIREFWGVLDDGDKRVLRQLAAGNWGGKTSAGERIQMAARVIIGIAEGARNNLQWDDADYEQIDAMQLHHATPTLMF